MYWNTFLYYKMSTCTCHIYWLTKCIDRNVNWNYIMYENAKLTNIMQRNVNLTSWVKLNIQFEYTNLKIQALCPFDFGSIGDLHLLHRISWKFKCLGIKNLVLFQLFAQYMWYHIRFHIGINWRSILDDILLFYFDLSQFWFRFRSYSAYVFHQMRGEEIPTYKNINNVFIVYSEPSHRIKLLELAVWFIVASIRKETGCIDAWRRDSL